MAQADKFAQEVHRRINRKFQRRKVIVSKIDEIWGIDLASMESLTEYNNGFKFILCVIDVFSKFAWCVPLKNKSAETVLNAVTDIIKKNHRSPGKIWVDKGSEFYNKDFLKWTKTENIVVYSTYGESKSVVVERFIRTLKEMITQYFTKTNSRDWVKILPIVVQTYNNRVHRTIGMTPTEASKPENEFKIYVNVYKDLNGKSVKQKVKFKVGDQVRVSRLKGNFEKGYANNFSYEVFTIGEILPTTPVTYKLIDYDNDPIEGSFYEQELVKTSVPDYYEIENILDERKVKGHTEYFVSFHGWPKKFNTWLSDDQIKDIPGDKEGLVDILAKRKRNASKFWENILQEK